MRVPLLTRRALAPGASVEALGAGEEIPLRYIAFDTETDGLFVHRGDRMFTYSTSDEKFNTTVVDERTSSHADLVRGTERVFDGSHEIIMQNAKFDLPMAENLLGRELRGKVRVHETMACDHILDNLAPSRKLEDIAWRRFGCPKEQDDATDPYLSDDMGLLSCPPCVLDPYQRADAKRPMLIFLALHPEIVKLGYQEPYDMECQLVWTTMSMEKRGIMVSRPRVSRMKRWLTRESTAALEEWRALTGDRGTPQGKNVPVVLERCGFVLKKKTAHGNKSTDKYVILALREYTYEGSKERRVLDAILRYRSYSPGGTTIQGYADAADEDGVVHPSIHQFGAARTGRESCQDPNLQNVSKETTLRNPYPIPARRVFRPKPGFVNFHIDYAGIEARLLAHYSGDPDLQAAFTTPGRDFHSEFAELIYAEEWAFAGPEKRKSLRAAAKNCDFGLAYGARLPKFAATAGLVGPDAHAAHKRCRARFPSYCNMSQRFIKEVKANGCIHTLHGRRLWVPRGQPYVGANYTMQGSAAGILKRAQIRVDDYLRTATSGEAGLILPIHDELVVEWPEKRLGEALGCLREIRELMIDFPQCSVPLEIEVELSRTSWADVEAYPLEEAA